VTAEGQSQEGKDRHPSLDERFDPGYLVVAYDPSWPRAAKDEIARVKDALGGVALSVEHVGSTSVPGLAAKPIIDLQVTVASLGDGESFTGPLEALGYSYINDPASPEYLFFARPLARPRSHHLFVCEAGGHEERRHLAVRDFLRAHPDDARAYEELKREVSSRTPRDRLAYIAGKDEFVQDLQRRALAWRQSR